MDDPRVINESSPIPWAVDCACLDLCRVCREASGRVDSACTLARFELAGGCSLEALPAVIVAPPPQKRGRAPALIAPGPRRGDWSVSSRCFRGRLREGRQIPGSGGGSCLTAVGPEKRAAHD